MSAAWLAGDVLAFDLETTGPNPDTARIVTACAVRCGPSGARLVGSWIVNPGVPIPPEATAVHGVTDAMASHGERPESAIRGIDKAFLSAASDGIPLVIMNANFDLAVLTYEAARIGLVMDWSPILDPRVIDLGCDVYRKGKRKLSDLAAHYGVRQGAAHTADGDAITAARIVWAQAKRYPLIADLTLEQMQEWQAERYREWADHLTEYYASQGKNERVDPSWPIRKPTQQQEAA